MKISTINPFDLQKNIENLKIWLKILITLFSFLFLQNLNAQETIDVKFFKQKFYDVLYLNTDVLYVESSINVKASSILKDSIFVKPKASLHYIDIKSPSAWFKFKLENTDIEDVVVSFVFPKVDSTYLFQLIDKQALLVSSLAGNQVYNDTVSIGETKEYLLNLRSLNNVLGKQGVSIYTDKSLQRLRYRQGEKVFNVVIINSLFIGAFIILFFYHFFLYVQNRKRIYIPYFMYILTLAVYFFVKHPLFMMYYATDEVLASNFFAFNIVIQPFIYIFYAQFTRVFWQTNEKFKSIDTLLRIIIIVSIVLVAIYLILIGLNHPVLLQIHDIYRIILIGLSIYILIYFSRHFTKETSYYIFGAGCYLFFSFMAFADSKFDLTDYRNLFMHIGAILEILFFAFGLGYKMKKIEVEKIKNQNELIEQYAENDQLQLALEEELKKQLSISQKENQMMEIESRLLRSRMNPHFLFNTMNALKNHIYKNKTTEASNYLDQLSMLLRRVLEYSGEKKISLKQELDLVENYLKLEQQRMDGNFEFQFLIPEDLDLGYIKLPPMILQPFVENSIWHGVRYLESRNGIIKIIVNEKDDSIEILIDDNGVGREIAKSIQAKNKTKPKSLATELTNERIELLRRQNEMEIDISIVDKPDHSGTIVKISINE